MADDYITGVTTPDGEPAYDIPKFSRFDEAIRALQNNDPGKASSIFNPLMQKLIDNMFYLKNMVENFEPYDDTVILDRLAELQQYINDYAYDDTALQETVAELRSEILVHDRRINNLTRDLAALTFELALNNMLNGGGLKNVFADKIESADDVVIVSGQYGDKKVYI